MRKITLILGLVMLLGSHAEAKTPPVEKAKAQNELDIPLTSEGSSQAERKLLNGDGYNKAGPLPEDTNESQGNHHCKTEEDCERE